MNELHDADLIRRLEQLGAVQPSAAATRRAVERVRRALLDAAPVGRPRRRRPWPWKRLAAAAVVLAALASLVWVLPSLSPVHASFAEVQQALKATGTMTCRQITKVKGKPDETVRLSMRADSLLRVDMNDGSYSILDSVKFRSLHVDPKERRARLIEGANLPHINFHDFIKNLPKDASARALPNKQLDGKVVLGFTVKVQAGKLPQVEFTVWADPATRLPVRIEMEHTGEQGGSMVIDSIVYGAELPATLFSFTPPAGFTLATMGTPELPAPPADPRLKDLVLTPLAGIGPVQFGMDRAAVEKLLGKPDTANELRAGTYVDLHYGSRGFYLGVSQKLGVVVITCTSQEVMVTRGRDFSGKTDKGIALGATVADIVSAYGEPNTKTTNQGSTYLSYSRLQAHFTLFGDKLVQITISRPRPAQ